MSANSLEVNAQKLESLFIPRDQVDEKSPTLAKKLTSIIDDAPGVIPIQPHNIPSQLARVENWHLWTYIENEGTGKFAKRQCHSNLSPAKFENLKLRTLNETARPLLDENGEQKSGCRVGLGLICDGIKVCALDIDDVVGVGPDGEWVYSPEVETFARETGCYAEVSVSATGLRLIFSGRCPLRSGDIPTPDGRKIEIKCSFEGKRYVTVTGEKLFDFTGVELSETDRIRAMLEWIPQQYFTAEALESVGIEGAKRLKTDRDFSDGDEQDPVLRELELQRLLPAVKDALRIIKAESPRHTMDRNSWIEILMAVKSCGFDDDTTLELCDEFSRDSPKYMGAEFVRTQLDSLSRTDGEVITVGSLFREAKQHGFVVPGSCEPYVKSAKEDFDEISQEPRDIRSTVKGTRSLDRAPKDHEHLGSAGHIDRLPDNGGISRSAIVLNPTDRLYIDLEGSYTTLEESITEHNRYIRKNLTTRKPKELRLFLSKLIKTLEVQTDRSGNREFVEVDMDLGHAVLLAETSAKHAKYYRVLKSVCYSPTLLPQAGLVTDSGYYPESQSYADLRSFKFAKVKSNPSRADAQNACSFLLNSSLCRYYSFAPESAMGQGLAVILSAPIMAIARPVIRNLPLLAMDASGPGCGKTEASKAAAVVLNEEANVFSGGSNSQQLDAAIVTNYKETKNQSQINTIDNVLFAVKSQQLDVILTTPKTQGRSYGTTEGEPLRWATTFITGNHLDVEPDLKRRSLVAHLEPLTSRDFADNFLDVIAKELPEIRAAFLIIIQAWFLEAKRLGAVQHRDDGSYRVSPDKVVNAIRKEVEAGSEVYTKRDIEVFEPLLASYEDFVGFVAFALCYADPGMPAHVKARYPDADPSEWSLHPGRALWSKEAKINDDNAWMSPGELSRCVATVILHAVENRSRIKGKCDGLTAQEIVQFALAQINAYSGSDELWSSGEHWQEPLLRAIKTLVDSGTLPRTPLDGVQDRIKTLLKMLTDLNRADKVIDTLDAEPKTISIERGKRHGSGRLWAIEVIEPCKQDADPVSIRFPVA